MSSMTAMTIRTWIQLPVLGNLGLTFDPKKPSSHRITRIMMIVHNMRFLLLNYLLAAARSVDPVTVDLAVGSIARLKLPHGRLPAGFE